MTHGRTSSLSVLGTMDRQNDPTLEGITANVKLLLKLIQDHNEACNKEEDGRRPQRVAGMITILDDLKSRIEKSQVSVRRAQFRRCNTELRRTPANKDKKPLDPIQDENEKLRRELYASVSTKKNVEKMFSSLGKEKEIMAAELARKAYEMKDLEEHLNDLKAQNEKLLAKAKACVAKHKEKVGVGGTQANAALQERNKLLGEQLLKSLDGYRSLKCKLRDTVEENKRIHMKMGEIAQDVAVGLDHIHGFRQQIAGEKNVKLMDIEKELSALESMFRYCFEVKVKIGTPERGDCVNLKNDMPAENTNSCLIRT